MEQQWADQQAAQMPFLALLQGATDIAEDDGGGRKRAAADIDDLLESCVTQAAATGRRRKRSRPRAAAPQQKKPAEEAESQRMTHIAVERNRRRLMNDHLASLRALIPAGYIPRVIQLISLGWVVVHTPMHMPMHLEREILSPVL
jgi:hypothetical protein